jgi:hypothetical protein
MLLLANALAYFTSGLYQESFMRKIYDRNDSMIVEPLL